MKDSTKELIRILLMIGVSVAGLTFISNLETKPAPKHHAVPIDTVTTVPTFMNKSAEEGLKEALIYYDIKFPEIVYAQAVLETGHFKSTGCLKHNNLFGLYDSKAKRYHRFNHWVESVVAYKKWIQRRYRPPEDYYVFLKRIKYAGDPEYINKLKQIVNSNDKRRGLGGGKDNS